MQPLASALIRRPFHWGITIVADADSGGLLPDVDPERAVSANEHGLVVLVRHAQDVESSEGDFEWAEVEVLVRLLETHEDTFAGGPELHRGRLNSPSGRISVGDADSEIIHPAHHGWNEVVVTVSFGAAVHDGSPDGIRIDLLPVEQPVD